MASVPGLFGKMPAHGDFVRRGWGDAVVAALDRRCGDAVLLLGARDLRENSAANAAVARFWVPSGTLGADAVHLVVAPSRDRVGRDFVLAVGVAGDAAWRHALRAGGALTTVLRAAVAGECDADATLAAIAATTDDADTGADAAGADREPPDTAQCWHGDAPVAVTAFDAGTLADLLCDRAAA